MERQTAIQVWRGWRSSPHYCIHMRQVEHGRRFRERDWGMASQLTLLVKVVRCRFSIGVDFQERVWRRRKRRSNGGGGQILMMTFKPELKGHVGLQVSRMFENILCSDRRSWIRLTTSRRNIYIYKYRPISLVFKYRILRQLYSSFHVVVAVLSIGSLIAGVWGVTSSLS